MRLERSLASVGVAPHAAAALAIAAARSRGMVVFCGPTGVGKTTLAQRLIAAQRRAVIHWVGDLRVPDEIQAALMLAERGLVVAVVRSGESRGLRDRWSDMGFPASLVESAAVVTVTQRRLARTREDPLAPLDALALEILAPDGNAMTGSLAEEARALVAAGVTSEEAARINVPDYA